jgi:glyoxylase-like metal-dependent hydrolase (beta-lactamase superfamily II)
MTAFDPIRLEAHNPGPMTGRGNNTYLLLGERRAALIDAGVGDPRHVAAIDRHLAGTVLERVLVTHGHRDHASGAAALAAGHRAASFHKYPWPGEDALYHVEWQPLSDGDELAAGGVRLRAIHTPGHSPDHLVFWHEPSRTAFTGDLVLAGGSVTIPWSRGGDMRQYLQTLKRMLALRPRRLLPAHGAVVLDPPALLEGHLQHRLQRERQIVEALGAGVDTVQGLVDSIYHGLDPAFLGGAGENVRAHLEMLRSEGRAVEVGARWTV